MNELQFKHHLKDLVHGHHHPEEHDWGTGSAKPASKTTAKRKTATAKAKPRGKAAKSAKSK